MTASDDVGFGSLLKRLRLSAGLTQEALAERAGVSARAVSDLERDLTRLPRLETARLLAEALDLDAGGRAHLLAAARPGIAGTEPLPRISTSLPRPLTPLFGRSGVVDAIEAQLTRGNVQLLTLTGTGGVGKTRLAIATAERAAGQFAGGAVFVDLAPLRDPRLVLTAIARQMEIDERDTLRLHDQLAVALGRKHVLLVLDNFEHLLPARTDVLALIAACPELVVLITSRVPLRVRGEREYRIAPLELPDEDAPADASTIAPAVALFIDRARDAGAEMDATPMSLAAVAAICRRLDGLPLAIELAAAWARLLPLDALLARLDHRLPLLVEGPHDLPARQRTMRDAIAWSYELLEPASQRLFRGMSVFTGGFTADAAEAVVPIEDGSGILSRLGALLDRGLLQAQAGASPADLEPRLTMLETLREYGLERLAEVGELEDRQRRHAAALLSMAEAAGAAMRGPNGPAWRGRLDRDNDNFRAALGWSLDAGDASTALRLAAALWRFWHERGYLGEGRRWLRRTLAVAEGQAGIDPRVRAQALVGAATLAIEQGDYGEASEHCAEAIALAGRQASPNALMEALTTQGLLAQERGDYPEAEASYMQALALARNAGDRWVEAAALIGLAYTNVFIGDIPHGIQLAEASVAILRETGDAHALAVAIMCVISNLSHSGAYDRVATLGDEALRLSRSLGDTGRVADTLWILGIAAQFQGDDARAIALHEENLALRRTRGDELGAIQPLTALASIRLKQGDYARARALLEETLITLDRYDDRWSRAMSLMFLGHVEAAQGHLAPAVERIVEGAALMRAIDNSLYLPWCLEGLAEAFAGQERWELVAMLSGSRDALYTDLALGVPPANPVAWTRTLDRARAALGNDGFAAAREAGRAWSPEEAIDRTRAIAQSG